MGNSDLKNVGPELAELLPQDGKPWYKVPHLLRLNLLLACFLVYSSATGYDGSMMNGLQSLPQWQTFMGHPKGAWLGFVNGSQAIGQFFGYPPAAWVMNKHGRKVPIYVGVFLIVAGSIIQTTAINPAMFCVARLIVGHGSAWVGSAPTLITETAYPTHRGRITSLYNCCYYVGTLIAAWVTYGSRNVSGSWAWRTPSIVQAAVPLLALPGIILSPESPRWLSSEGRTEEARRVLIQYHAGGDSDSALVDFEITEIEKSLELEKRSKREMGYSDMIKTKGNRHRLFITVTLGIAAQWSGNGIVSYYLSLILASVGITSVTQQTLLNAFLQVWNLLLAMTAALMVERLGRRFLFLASTVGMLFSYIVITGLSGSYASTGSKAVGTAVIPWLFIYYGFYDIAFTPLLIAYTAEIWSYLLRARGLAVVFSVTLLAVFFNIFVNPIALEALAWKYYFVYIAFLIIITLIVYFTYPETRGHTLEEMARVFEGDEAAVPRNGSVLQEVREHKASLAGSVHLETVIGREKV